jgi:hypothetical protein
MLIKCTMVLQLATNTANPNLPARRIGGWTESWYYNGVSVADCYNKFWGGANGNVNNLCAARAGLLPNSAAIVGQRFQQLDPVGPSQSLNQEFAGQRAWPCDVPQMALLCKVPGTGVRNIRQMILRGIPDQFVVEGEFAPNQTMTRNLNSYIGSLANFAFRALDAAARPTAIFDVQAEAGDIGRVVTVSGVTPVTAIGQIVTIRGTATPGGPKISGQFQVTELVGVSSFRIRNWTAGHTYGGTVALRSFINPAVDAGNITIGRVIVKKVGRPPVGYVGRRSRAS